MAHRFESQFNRVRAPHVWPMPVRGVVEFGQRVAILRDFLCGQRVFGHIRVDELVERDDWIGTRRCVLDLRVPASALSCCDLDIALGMFKSGKVSTADAVSAGRYLQTLITTLSICCRPRATAGLGALRAFRLSSNSHHDSFDSRYPSMSASGYWLLVYRMIGCVPCSIRSCRVGALSIYATAV